LKFIAPNHVATALTLLSIECFNIAFLFLFLFCKKEQRKRKKKEAKKKEKEIEKTLSKNN